MAGFRFRRFGTRLLVFFVGLLAGSLLTTYLIVSHANRANALAAIQRALDQGALQFENISSRRQADLLRAARMLAGDYAIRQLFIAETVSPATIRSALPSYQDRIQADVIVMLDAEGNPLADTRGPTEARDEAAFAALHDAAVAKDLEFASGTGFLEGRLHQLALVPVLGPGREAFGWIGMGFRIDESTARQLKTNAGLEVTFLATDPAPRVLASTLPADTAAELAADARQSGFTDRSRVALGRDTYVTAFRHIVTEGGATVWIILQRSLAAELAPARAVERILLLVTLAGLGAAVLAALLLARSIGRPVQQLAAHTARIASGDYDTRLALDRVDELGRLSEAFNAMSAGLAERDRVRDLLDKNVSPAVAARLLREGAALGGEERTVTILFADLRGFTTLSEKLPAPAVVHLLNRYLDRMSQAIEREGGVIDKFIGDEIMALFGAPVSLDDAPDRALRAALAMRAALATLNAEFAAEGQPTLAFGIGINTAHVVAGNIGSTRRLNYSVVGDGVNLAARLQALTRKPEFAADILVSDSTLGAARATYRTRPLGAVEVRGRAQSVLLHALDDLA